MINIFLIFLISIFTLTGCGSADKVELEDRDFVVAIGIDSYDAKTDEKVPSFNDETQTERFTVSMTIPNLDVMIKGGDEDKKSIVKSASNETIVGAEKIIDSYSSNNVYLGQTKLAVLGDGTLKDPVLFKETIDALERNPILSRNIYVLSTSGKALEVLSTVPPQQPMVGIFIENYYENNPTNSSLAFKLTLNDLIYNLQENGDLIIPQISVEDEELKLGGAAIIKDYELVGWMNDLETTGYLWMKGLADGSVIITRYYDTYIPLTVSKNKTKIHFEEVNDHLVCNSDIKVEGTIQEFTFDNSELNKDEVINELSKAYSSVIIDELFKTWDCFNNKYVVDGYNFEDYLRKHNYDLYMKYSTDWDLALQNMELNPTVEVEITGVGSKN